MKIINSIQIMIIFIFLFSCKDIDNQNIIRTKGLINDSKIVYNKGKGCELIYTFKVNNKDIIARQNDLVRCNCFDYKGKILEVLYDKIDNNKAFLLLNEYYYNKFNLYPPDSLKWLNTCN